MIHFRCEALLAPRINGRRPRPANVARHYPVSAPEQFDRPGHVLEAEATAFPIRRGLFRAQAIEIDRYINFLRPELLDKVDEFFSPILAQDRAAPFALMGGAVIRPGMHFESPGSLCAVIAENPVRPPAFKIPATPHAYLFHLREFERAIDPTAATPFGGPDVRIGMIIKRNHRRSPGEPAEPERCQVMKISRAVDQKWRQPTLLLAIETLHLARRGRETQPRPPTADIATPERESTQLPGIIEIQVQGVIEPLNHEEKNAKQGAQPAAFKRSLVAIAKKTNNRKQGETPDEPDIFCRVQDAFRVTARKTSAVLGTAWAFMGAVSIIVIWGLSGHIFHYSDTWQLIINTGTTIVTFLMVFLIQNTQNRDAKAIQLKLDELIRSISGARNRLMDLEKLSDEDLKKFQEEFERLRNRSEAAAATVSKIDRKANSR
jgi:low affinity Fe/Cu permease